MVALAGSGSLPCRCWTPTGPGSVPRVAAGPPRPSRRVRSRRGRPTRRSARSTTPSSTATTTRSRRPRAPSTSRTPARSPTRWRRVSGGTTLVLADGTYDGDFTVRGVTATPSHPWSSGRRTRARPCSRSGSAIVVKEQRARRRRRPDVPERREHPAQAGVVEQRPGHPQHLRPRRRRRGLQQVALHRRRGQPPQPDRPQHLPEQDRPRQLPDARRLDDPGLAVRPDRPQPVREDRPARGEREGGRPPGMERHLHVLGLHGVRVTTCWRSATATRRS